MYANALTVLPNPAAPSTFLSPPQPAHIRPGRTVPQEAFKHKVNDHGEFPHLSVPIGGGIRARDLGNHHKEGVPATTMQCQSVGD